MTRRNRLVIFILITVLLLTSLGYVLAVRSQSSENVLAFWGRYDPDFVKPAVDAYNARLKAAGKTIRIEYTQVGAGDLAAKLAAGQTPDIAGIDIVEGPRFSSAGTLLDLTARFDKLDYRATFNPTMLNMGMRDGKVYAVPAIADVSMLVYNKKLFKAAGLDPDRGLNTWDDLRSAAQKLTHDGVTGFELWCGNGAWLMYALMPFAWTNGGRLLSVDGRTALLTDPKTVEAMQFLADLKLKDHVTVPTGTDKGCAEDKFDPAFDKGTIAIAPRAASSIVGLIRNQPELDLGVSLFPGKIPGSSSAFLGGDLVAIPSKSRHPDEAWEAIQYFLSADVQVDLLAAGGFIPVRSDLVDNKITAADARFKLFAKTLEVGYVPWSPAYEDLIDPVQAGLQSALNGEKSVIEALTEANTKIQAVLDKQR